jgi:hypothetical protein
VAGHSGAPGYVPLTGLQEKPYAFNADIPTRCGDLEARANGEPGLMAENLFRSAAAYARERRPFC